MARLFSSGFEYANATDGGAWDLGGGTSTVASARSGLRGYRFNPTASGQSLDKYYAAIGNTNDIYLRTYINLQTALSVQSEIVMFWTGNGGAVSISVRMNTSAGNNTLELWDEFGAVQLGSGSPALATTTWYRLEVGYVNSTRTVTAYLDGTQWATGVIGVTEKNLDTMSLGLGILTAVTGELWMDDVALNDQTGSTQTGLPGTGGLVLALVNVAGDNSNGVRGGTDSGSDYGQLDENPPNDLTDYYILDNQNDILDLGIEDQSANPYLTSGSSITLVHVGARHRVDAGTQVRTYQLRIKSQASGTVQSGTATNHNDIAWKTNGDVVPRNYTLTSYIDPQGAGPWTTALLDSTQIGITITSAVTAIFVTALWALIEFVPPPALTEVPWPHAFEHGAI